MCLLYFLGYWFRYVRKVVFRVCCIPFGYLIRFVITLGNRGKLFYFFLHSLW